MAVGPGGFSSRPPASARTRVLESLVGLLGRRSYRTASLPEMARTAGTTRDSLLRHFGDFDTLYIAVIGQARRRIDVRLRAALDPSHSPSRRLHDALIAFFEVVHEQPATMRLVFRVEAEMSDGCAAAVTAAGPGVLAAMEDLRRRAAPTLARPAVEIYRVLVEETAIHLSGWAQRHDATAERDLRRFAEEYLSLLRFGMTVDQPSTGPSRPPASG